MRILKHYDDGVSSQEHLTNISLLVHLRPSRETLHARKGGRKTYICFENDDARWALTGLALDFPLPDLGVSVQISFTFSSTMLQCLSKALTRARSLWLFRTLMSTYFPSDGRARIAHIMATNAREEKRGGGAPGKVKNACRFYLGVIFDAVREHGERSLHELGVSLLVRHVLIRHRSHTPRGPVQPLRPAAAPLWPAAKSESCAGIQRRGERREIRRGGGLPFFLF